VTNGTTSPGIGVTASAVLTTPYTTHGWRPTSVTTHPASMAAKRDSSFEHCRWLLPEDPALVARSTAEGALRGGDASVAWAALVDTNELGEAVAILAVLEAALRPAQVTQRAAYRLVYSAHSVPV